MEFRQFITSLLKRGKLNKKHLEEYTDEEGMKKFQTAFTHKSFDRENNYELVELIGDVVVNYSIINYIREWDPKIVSVKYLTRLKHNITSKKELAKIAENAGFLAHIKMSDELKETFEQIVNGKRIRDEDYMSVLEDTFEAFIGTVKILVDERTGFEGAGVAVAYQIIKSFLQTMDISLQYEKVFDAKTRLKELCDKRGWVFNRNIILTREVKTDEEKYYETTIWGYPYGNKRQEDANKEKLAFVKEHLKGDSQNKAAEMALHVLKSRFGIYDIHPNPYERIN